MGTGSVSALILPYLDLPEKVHFLKAFDSSQHWNLWPFGAASSGLSWCSWMTSVTPAGKIPLTSEQTLNHLSSQSQADCCFLGCLNRGSPGNVFQSEHLRE